MAEMPRQDFGLGSRYLNFQNYDTDWIDYIMSYYPWVGCYDIAKTASSDRGSCDFGDTPTTDFLLVCRICKCLLPGTSVSQACS